MMEEKLKNLFKPYKNIILLGEAGSGKSEVGINLAELLAESDTDRSIHLFDMDQTKPLFRTRDAKHTQRLKNVEIHYQKQLMDSPIVVGGVEEAITNSSKRVILDIGGGEQGARMIGQFAELLQGPETIVLYLINSYRPWSMTETDMRDTMKEILGGCGLNRFNFVANPNLGPGTTLQDITEGYLVIKRKLGIEPEFVCVLSELMNEVREVIDIPLLPVKLALATSRVELMKNS